MLVAQEDPTGARLPPNRFHAGWRAIGRVGRRLTARVGRFSMRRVVKGSRRARSVLIAASIARHPWEYYTRRKAAAAMATRPARVTIRRSEGFARFDASDFEQVPSVVRLCREIYFNDKRSSVKPPPESSTKHKGYLIELLSDEDLVRYPRLVDFCVSPPVVAAVSRYLGTLPVLRRVGLWLSFPAPMDGASRLFHLDPEDFTQVRMFLNVIDIAAPQGPLTFLPAHVSDDVLGRLWRDENASRARKPELRRWTDQEILSRAGGSPCIDLVGPAGSGAFVDTSRCLHYGSRMEPDTIHLVFQAQYLRYHFPYATATNRFDPSHAAGDAVVSRLLAPRPGYACNWHDR